MINVDKVEFEKMNGLVPAIVCDYITNQVLMQGFMNKEALDKTLEIEKVTFFSRSRNELWTKGETSGNFLKLKNIKLDCDNDSILVFAEPKGNTCHKDRYSCFDIEKYDSIEFLSYLYKLVKTRKEELPEGSYTTKLFNKGENRIIQKVGEEAIETVIAAKNNDREEIINEVSDLMFHMFVMLADKNIEFKEIVDNLEQRHK